MLYNLITVSSVALNVDRKTQTTSQNGIYSKMGFTVLLGLFFLQVLPDYAVGQQLCDSQSSPPIFTKQVSDLRNETRAMTDPGYRGLMTSEGEVTRTAMSVVPRGPAFLEDRVRAVCPWSYVRNEDNNRIPRVIYEAKCEHQSTCFSSLGDILPVRRPRCSEIYYYTNVMRRTGCDDNGQNEYVKVLEKISAGCTSLRPAGS